MPRNIDLAGVMLTVIVAGVIAFIGLVVLDEVVGTVDLLEQDADGNYESEFGEAASDLTGAIDSFFGMIGVVFIVIVLAVILAYLYAMRGNGR